MDMHTVVFATGSGPQSYDVASIGASEMALAAVNFMDVRPEDHACFEDWAEAFDRANRFATFCVAETIDDDDGRCDPTRSFRVLFDAFLRAEAEPASA